MINMQFYYNKSEDNRLDKDLDFRQTVQGSFKDDVSIMKPIVLVALSMDDIRQVNYIYIEELNRYYFVTDMIAKGKNLTEIHCRIDVLMTYRVGIRGNYAIIRRNEKEFNLYLNDGVFKTYQNPQIQTKEFPNGFTNLNFVLSVAGGTGSSD